MQPGTACSAVGVLLLKHGDSGNLLVHRCSWRFTDRDDGANAGQGEINGQVRSEGRGNLDLYEVMRTTFAARQFTDDPVPDEVLQTMLENARFAPSGGNRQGWKVVIVRNDDTKRALIPLIEPTLQRYWAQVQAGEAPWNTINPTRLSADEIAATEFPRAMVDSISLAPVVLLVFVDLSVVASFDSGLPRVGVISGASIYPFVWNILLAARNEGFGGTLTTFVGGQEGALKELLGVPDEYAFAAMLPIGKPVKQLTKLTRKAVEEFAVRERFDGEPLA